MQRITFLCLIIAFSNYGQITINTSDFTSAYDSIRYSNSVDQIDYSITGENVQWNYSNLIAISQELKEYKLISDAGFLVQASYGPSASSVYQASYFSPNNDLPVDQLNQFLPVSLEGLNAFFKNSNSQLTKVGYSLVVNGADVPFTSDTIETKYHFPLNYLDSFSTVGYTSIDLNPIVDLKFKQHISSEVVVDGYGVLSLPTGNYEVLRVKRQNFEIDSIYQSFNGAGTWISPPPRLFTDYEWVGLDQGDCLMKVVVVDANGQEQIQSIEYQDGYLGLDASLEVENIQIMIFPNPVIDNVSILSDIPISKIELFNLNRQIIGTENYKNESSINWDFTQYKTGIYLIELTFSNGKMMNRLIIKD